MFAVILSRQKKLKESYKLNMLKHEQDNSTSEDDMLAQFRYSTISDNNVEKEVKAVDVAIHSNSLFNRIDKFTCNYIKPVPSQLLTVYADAKNTIPLHIELDSGASINFCEESAANILKFHITYSKQTSILGDGLTVIESVGEISFKETTRNLHLRQQYVKS